MSDSDKQYYYNGNWISWNDLHAEGYTKEPAITLALYNNLGNIVSLCDSSIQLNYRYAKAGYTTQGLIDEEVFRWTLADGLVTGQTYNDGQWAFIGSSYLFLAQNGTTSSTYLYPNIRWDGEFNGTKTFA